MKFFTKNKKKEGKNTEEGSANPLSQIPQDAPAQGASEIENDISDITPPEGLPHSSVPGRNNARDEHTITVYDPGSKDEVTINGDIITAKGGICEVRENMRDLVIASSNGEIFYSRSHQNNPRVLSEIQRIESINGEAHCKAPIDMSSLSEMYRRHYQRSRVSTPNTNRNEQSRMQRDLMSIVAKAAARNASDIHIIVNTNHAVVRFRVDGVMQSINEMQPQYAFELLSAAFVMADASDTAYQKRAYQGARISSITSELPAGVQSLRLQFNPLANDGRYLIMRILYSGDGQITDLKDLGYSDEQVRQISIMSARPVGINIVSGPTGSGKSTTLKAVLEQLIRRRNGEVNTITIEDPPEYVISDAQQMPVTNAKTQEERSEAFTQAISAGLRSDPDIMMIGEIRDLASAELAVEGALSGHPIFASLHSNTGMDVLTRLRDMGIEDFKVFNPTVFSGLIGQRLVRNICPNCRVPLEVAVENGDIDPLVYSRIQDMIKVTPEHILKKHTIYTAGCGCDQCSNGYNGRTVISEIILPDDHFMELMQSGRNSEARKYWFKSMNGIDMLGSAWIRALEGKVSPIDIENSVELLRPLEVHKEALEYWLNTLPEFANE
jgi:type II secretory ATPase GspE/PulE/Tfp pilus assembly ATPase PilB-like protein